MKSLSKYRMYLLRSLLVLGSAGFILPALAQPVYTVTNTNDNGAGSLRQAITSANAGGVPANIAFNITGSGSFSIDLLSALPAMAVAIDLDGTTQPGYAGTPLIALKGDSAGANVNGLTISGNNSVVRGLAITEFSGAGIFINGSGNTIGGNGGGTGNIIAANSGAGVSILSGTNDLVRGNSIFSNGGLSIDLGATGTPVQNHVGASAGPNELQNYPVLTGTTASGNSVTVIGDLNSNTNSEYQIDFYYDTTTNANGFSDGSVYLGYTTVTTDASGNANFHVLFSVQLPVGSYISATATDTTGNTSEFANHVLFTPNDAVNVSMTMIASSNAVMIGDQVNFTLTLANSGTNPATDVVVTDVLPPALNFASAVPEEGSATSASNIVIWNAGTIAAGGSVSMTIYASPQAAGTFTNLASFVLDEFNLNSATSNLVPVTVYAAAPVQVSTQPAPQLLNLGALLNLVVNIVGPTAGVHYQWRLNGDNIPGATNATYSKSGILSTDGGTYTVVIANQFGAETSQGALISLGGLLTLPAGTNFASRGALINLLGPEVCDNINVSGEPGDPVIAGVPGGKPVWFTWTPLLSGVATITTAGSSFDTLLGVYTGNSLSNLTEIASDDDSGGYYTSQVKFNAVAGTTYNIAIDGAYGQTGQIVVQASENILAPALPVITSQPTVQATSFGGTAIFSVQASGSGLTYQWYFNGNAIANATYASLLVKNVTASNVGLYTVQVSNSAASIMSKAASLQISMVDGNVNTNWIAQDKFQAAFLAVSNSLQNGTSSKNSGSSIKVSGAGGTSRGYSSTQVFSQYGSGTQSGEPNHCGDLGGDSTWTSVQAPASGIMEMDTDGSTFNTILAVYTGSGDDFSDLTAVACDVGSGQGGTNSKVTFAATSNTVYYVAVDGVYGASGTVVLNANTYVPPVITSQPGSQTVAAGTTVTLNATASGNATPSLRWYKNGVAIPGATNGTLVITNFQSTNAGNYMMTATNTVGSAATIPATLMVNGPMRLDSFTYSKSNQCCGLRLIGSAGTSYIIQVSTNMHNWTPIATNTAANGFWNFSDNYAGSAQRFYRAVPGH